VIMFPLFSAMFLIFMTQISLNPNCLVTRRQLTLLLIVIRIFGPTLRL
jgi:hypothetical protein